MMQPVSNYAHLPVSPTNPATDSMRRDNMQRPQLPPPLALSPQHFLRPGQTGQPVALSRKDIRIRQPSGNKDNAETSTVISPRLSGRSFTPLMPSAHSQPGTATSTQLSQMPLSQTPFQRVIPAAIQPSGVTSEVNKTPATKGKNKSDNQGQRHAKTQAELPQLTQQHITLQQPKQHLTQYQAQPWQQTWRQAQPLVFSPQAIVPPTEPLITYSRPKDHLALGSKPADIPTLTSQVSQPKEHLSGQERQNAYFQQVRHTINHTYHRAFQPKPPAMRHILL